MKVTRDVIVDLWPVYESGAASPDSRALVEEFLEGDPELGRRLRQGEEEMSQLLNAVPVLPPPDAEKAALERIQMLLRLRYYVLALAGTLTVAAAMLRAYRASSVVLALLAVLAWVLLWIGIGAHDLKTGAYAPDRERRLAHYRRVSVVVAVMFTVLAGLMRQYRLVNVVVAGLGVLGWLALVVHERWRRAR
jgi:hypothetical protein